MATVADGIKAQLRNIESTYGHSIDELAVVVAKSGLTKHADVVGMLKERYGMAHGAAHRVSLTVRERTANPGTDRDPSPNALMAPTHDAITRFVDSLGPDVELSPKKSYVSLRRRKQFAMVQPAAKWVNVGLVLPKALPAARLQSAEKWNALFTHRVRVHAPAEVDAELKSWLRDAYEAAG